MNEALKLALEALENISTALREDDVLGSDSELMLNAITAIKEALEESENDELIIRYHEMTIKRLEKRIEELTAQPEQDDHRLQIAMRQWDDWKTYALELEGEVIGYKQILDAQPEQKPDCYGYAARLATSIWKQHYQKTAPEWEVFDNLIGVLTQIDNMAAGLISPPQPEERNFCPRCGKRTVDLTAIHTCTPPQGNT